MADMVDKNPDLTLNKEKTLEFLKLNPLIVDVRPASVHSNQLHPKGSVNIPLDEIIKLRGKTTKR